MKRDALRLMDHQRTLQLKTDSLSGQDIFEAFAIWRQQRNWNGGHYQFVQCLNI